MKKMIAILTTALLVFIATENYMLSNMQISGSPGAYTVTVFGADFIYE